MAAKPTELAILEINGQLYKDWETVVVVHNTESPTYAFRFTCSEGMPLAKNWVTLQIKPGDKCQVTLAGQPAVEGLVSTRQVFYDARRHHIEIQGVSNSAGTAYANAVSKTMEYKNVTWEQFARDQLKRLVPKVNLVIDGGQLPQIKFPRISLMHGQTILEALEIPLRSLGHFPITSTVKGDFRVLAGPIPGGAAFVEGQNILEGREIIYHHGIANFFYQAAQNTGNNKAYGPKVTHVPFLKQEFSGMGAISNFFQPATIIHEMPVHTKDRLQPRIDMDDKAMNESRITVFVTVQGWLDPASGDLYKVGAPYTVKSPMLMMNGSEGLKAKTITFTQDNERGSRTTLELRNQAAMFPGVPQGQTPRSQ